MFMPAAKGSARTPFGPIILFTLVCPLECYIYSVSKGPYKLKSFYIPYTNRMQVLTKIMTIPTIRGRQA